MNVIQNLHPKVVNPALAGALVTVIVWGLSQYAHVTLPTEVSAALVVIVGVIVGYFSPAAPPPGV